MDITKHIFAMCVLSALATYADAQVSDYYIHASHSVCTIDTHDNFCSMPWTVSAGEKVKYVGLQTEPGNVDVTAELINGYFQDEEGIQLYPVEFLPMMKTMIFPVVGDLYGTNRWTLVLVSTDEYGPKEWESSTFFTPVEGIWEIYGEGEFTDLFLSTSHFTEAKTATVTIEQRKDRPGYFRLKNPYADMDIDKGFFEGHDDHEHYVYINAEDPDFVYVEEAPIGVQFGHDSCVASSEPGNLLNRGKKITEIKASGTKAGVLRDGVFTFPEGVLKYCEPGLDNGILKDAGSGILLKVITADIDEISGDTPDDPVEYFDLQGNNVQSPYNGIFIRKQGSKTSKVRIP